MGGSRWRLRHFTPGHAPGILGRDDRSG
jgi:hypothetical protein